MRTTMRQRLKGMRMRRRSGTSVGRRAGRLRQIMGFAPAARKTRVRLNWVALRCDANVCAYASAIC